MRIAVVSTSINARPEAYAQWAADPRVDLIVAGDYKTPPELHGYLDELGAVYLTPDDQSQRFPTWSHLIGWNNIQRRSTAIMSALQMGTYDYLITVDDDNHPHGGVTKFIDGFLDVFGPNRLHTVMTSTSGYLNTGALCQPQFHQRGVPYGLNTSPWIVRTGATCEVVVAQAQVLGDPDCDAIERMCNAPYVTAVRSNAVVRSGVYAAFNTQATMWRADWAPVMACLPKIGRYDDIFASYIFARLSAAYRVSLFVGEPCVTQVRNDHDLVKDLRAELWGMERVFEFCGALNNAHVSKDMPLWQAYDELIYATAGILPRDTVSFAKAWVQDWRNLK